MPGYFEGQVVSCIADPDGAAVDPGADECAESGRPARRECGQDVEDGRGEGHGDGEGVDEDVCRF